MIILMILLVEVNTEIPTTDVGISPQDDDSLTRVKSLNAPAAQKLLDMQGLNIATTLDPKNFCVECKKPMNTANHYRSEEITNLCQN